MFFIRKHPLLWFTNRDEILQFMPVMRFIGAISSGLKKIKVLLNKSMSPLGYGIVYQLLT